MYHNLTIKMTPRVGLEMKAEAFYFTESTAAVPFSLKKIKVTEVIKMITISI